MKTIKKLSVLLAMLLTVVSVTGAACKRQVVEKIDEGKTQLFVSNFAGGFGGEWLDNAIERFEEMYKDESFEEGKTGVQIIPDHNMSGPPADFASSSFDVFFFDNLPYFDRASDGSLLDLTELVNEKIPGENKSILEKMNPEYKRILEFNDKYFALPEYMYFGSFIYDVDLFEEQGFYFAKDKSLNNGFIRKGQLGQNDARTAGPDGIEGNRDDGLPSTVDEFYELIDHINNDSNAIPMIWTGKARNYITRPIRALGASLAGFEAWNANFTFNGKIKYIDTMTDQNNYTTQEVQITPANGYLLTQQSSKLEALKFVEKMFSNEDYYYKDSTSTTLSHTDAQEVFVYSYYEDQPIAMLLEANYWMNEGKAALERLHEEYPGSEDHVYGFMPMPRKVHESDTDAPAKNTLYNMSQAFSCINAKVKGTPQERLAKLFLQYCHSDETLLDFTLLTNTFKAYEYGVEEIKTQLNPFAQDVWELVNQSDVVIPMDSNKLYMENSADFGISLKATVGDTTYSTPFEYFMDKHPAKDYFDALKIDKDAWDAKYGKYFQTQS